MPGMPGCGGRWVPLAPAVRRLVLGLIAWGALGVRNRALAMAARRAPLPGGSPGTSLEHWYQEEQPRRRADLERRLAAVCAASPSGAAVPGPAIPSGEGC